TAQVGRVRAQGTEELTRAELAEAPREEQLRDVRLGVRRALARERDAREQRPCGDHQMFAIGRRGFAFEADEAGAYELDAARTHVAAIGAQETLAEQEVPTCVELPPSVRLEHGCEPPRFGEARRGF